MSYPIKAAFVLAIAGMLFFAIIEDRKIFRH